jgi:hypothetical protein
MNELCIKERIINFMQGCALIGAGLLILFLLLVNKLKGEKDGLS